MTEPTGKRDCPKCEGKLLCIERRGMILESCSGCEGMWFDAGELNRMVGMIPKFAAGSGTATSYACVGCGEAMTEYTFPRTEVKVDRCDACHGVWLDRRELEDLKEQLDGAIPADDAGWAERAQAAIDATEQAIADRSRCGSCGGKLAHATRGRVVIDVCGGCKGIWFDCGELTAVLGISRTVKYRKLPASKLRCVRCPDQGLVDTEYPRTGIAIAMCPDCRGHWVPGGDLERIAEACKVALPR